MGLFDKFLNVMRLNPDDEDDFYDDDYYDEEEDEAPRKKLFSKSEDDFAPDNEVREKPARTSEDHADASVQKADIRSRHGSLCDQADFGRRRKRDHRDTLLMNRTVVLNVEGI